MGMGEKPKKEKRGREKIQNKVLGIDMSILGFPGGPSGKEPACQSRRHKRRRLDPWVRKVRWRRVWQSTPVFLPRESHGQRCLVVYSPQGHKELDTTEAT